MIQKPNNKRKLSNSSASTGKSSHSLTPLEQLQQANKTLTNALALAIVEERSEENISLLTQKLNYIDRLISLVSEIEDLKSRPSNHEKIKKLQADIDKSFRAYSSLRTWEEISHQCLSPEDFNNYKILSNLLQELNESPDNVIDAKMKANFQKEVCGRISYYTDLAHDRFWKFSFEHQTPFGRSIFSPRELKNSHGVVTSNSKAADSAHKRGIFKRILRETRDEYDERLKKAQNALQRGELSQIAFDEYTRLAHLELTALKRQQELPEGDHKALRDLEDKIDLLDQPACTVP